MELIEQIKVVAEARRKAQGLSEAKKSSLDRWEQDNLRLLSEVASATEQVGEAEAKLRELTLQAYEETGDKAPAPGVGIREVTKLEYDQRKAFEWALEHKIVLKLDVSAFEKMAKMASETRPSFVTIFTEPQAIIATNLEV